MTASSTGGAVSYRAAAELLAVGDRRVRQLIAGGRLVAVGAGHRKRITVASIEAYQGCPLRNSEINSEICGKSERNEPKAEINHLDSGAEDGHDGRMQIERLSFDPISTVARQIGVPSYTLRKLAKSGQIPAERFGSHFRIPSSYAQALYRKHALKEKGSE